MGANAQTSVWTFTAGQTLTAAQMNDTARTGVPVFATTATRDAAFGGTGEKTLAEGQMCYIEAAPKRLQVYDGTAWQDVLIDVQTYTPTFTGITVGNGTVATGYVQVGKVVNGFVTLTFGSTTSVTGTQFCSMPVTGRSAANASIIGHAYFGDASPADRWGGPLLQDSTTNMQPCVFTAGGTYTTISGVTSTIPFTWAVNDILRISFNYLAA